MVAKSPVVDVTGNSCPLHPLTCFADTISCDSTAHSLSGCPIPTSPLDPTPFATCFICLASGHLSSLCPSNPGRGIYVNGGNCKVCGSTAHRAKDCPDEMKANADADAQDHARRKGKGEVVLGVGSGVGADEDDFMAVSREDMGRDGPESKGKRKRHPPAKNGERPGLSKQTHKQDVEGPTEESQTVLPRQEINSEAPEARPGPTWRAGPTKAKVVKF